MENDSSSDDDTDDSCEDEQDAATSNGHRSTREIQWCRVRPHRKKVVWPPPSNSTPSTSTHLKRITAGNLSTGSPLFGSKMQLFSQTGYHLAVYPDGKIRGTPDENDLHTFLELTSAGYPGHVRIKALLTNLYIAMDRRGKLYGEADPMMEPTVFIESFQGSYTVYLSRKYAHNGWYIGIQKNGKIKKGPRTGYGQKAIKFLPRRSRFIMNKDGQPFSNHVRLWSQTGFNLTIRSTGQIIGTDDDSDLDSLIEITSGGDVSLVRLRGINSQLYVCFDHNGHLYGEKNPENEGTIFKEAFSASYTTFQTQLDSKEWFIGIKKNGQPKKGQRTEGGQKAVRFLPRR
ncbi:uncharacterized protein LOC130442944 [Diorhabda sublineata]|uniref:uncharacterized protein LOC130442944 n=1 Tax=Diorhabda sublineata TaxID=1163346 RepID=UPI0024E17A15|nr:uncharacterized protein LOC130442944 [Diorhabda sublineata]